MSKMSQAVQAKLEALRHYHSSKKQGRLSFLVRPLTVALGVAVIIVGAIAIPLPGPGWLIVFVGIGILSLELERFSRILNATIAWYERGEKRWQELRGVMKVVSVFLLFLLVVTTFLVTFVLSWNLGMWDWSKSWSQPWVDALPQWLVNVLHLSR